MVMFVCYGRGDARTFDLYDFTKGNPVYSDRTSTSFAANYTIGGTAKKTVFNGSGYKYFDGAPFNGGAYEGVTTSATNYVSGKLNAEMSGFSITQEKAFEYINWNDPQRVLQDVFKGNDKITGSIYGDYLDGWGGSDTLTGGKGSDTFLVDRATDVVIEKAAEGTDTVLASATYKLGAKQEIEILKTVSATATTAINLTGNEFANTITGNAGANVINGGLGNDILKGGAGQDTFFFNTKPSSANLDHITDFRAVDDTIRLENAIFTALTKTGAITEGEFALIASKTASVDPDAHILYEKATGTLYYDADGGSATGRIAFAVLDNKVALTFQDFAVV